ncbi:MAG: zinc ribbon domain-containing protein [Oscillospiraceae bacterium]|nr:zinc ribbon domain-containing protein [Oscillospiraceae bacterium]
MYCVKCGVSLPDGAEKCPLCGTAVWNPDGFEAEPSYDRNALPEKPFDRNPVAILLTVISILAALAVTAVCLVLYRGLGWGDYVLASILLFFVVAVLPFWFTDPNPVVFIPVDTVAVELFLLFICLRTGGHWFMSFAFPCVGIVGLISTASAALLKYLRKGRYIVIGGMQIALGLFCILLEFFQHITFETEMFRWSLFASIALFVSGAFLLCVGLIRPLRDFVSRVFFL